MASAVRLVAADARGVTVRLDLPAVKLGPADAEGRSNLEVAGLDPVLETGRPLLPAASATIAIPPGATVSAQVIGAEGETLQDNVRLRVGMKAGFRSDGGRIGPVPYMEAVPAIEDGPWPASPIEVSEPFTIRRQRVVSLRIVPHRWDAATGRLWTLTSITVRLAFTGGETVTAMGVRDEGHWEPLLQGTLLNYDQGLGFREPAVRAGTDRPAGATLLGTDFDEGEPEVRVGPLDTTAVYAFDFDELATRDYPTGVPANEVSVHRHEYVQDPAPGTPPYVTIELPIEVDDRDGDGFFGSGDRILAFVQTWAERSRATMGQRTWGDGEVVYVTRLRGGNGRRIPSRPGWRDLTLTPLTSYPWTQRWEKSDFYIPVFHESWTDTGSTDQFLWSPRGTSVQLSTDPDSFRFETNDLDSSRSVRFRVAWRGTREHNNGQNHVTSAQLRNARNQFTTIVDPTSPWGGRQLRIVSATLNGSALSEGNRNVLRSWGRTSPCPDPVDCTRVFALIDWFEATYWRRFNALDGYLSLNTGPQGPSADYEIHATGFGFPDQMRIYDVTDTLSPVRLTVTPGQQLGTSYPFGVKFQDNAGGFTRQYVVFERPKAVPTERYAAVTRRRLTERTDIDYLLIVPEAFLPAVEPLRALRESMGLRVAVAPLESVNDEFNGGRRSAHAIKRYIRYAYRNWNAAFVLLVGDASEDPRHLIPISTPDWVPAPKIAGPVPIPDGLSSVNESIPSDPWYVWCVDCPDASRQRTYDLFIGRLPVNTLQQTQDVVDKLVAYETIRPEESWRRDMLLLADDAYSTLSTFGGDPGSPTYCYKGYEEVFLDISNHVRRVIQNEGGLMRSNPYVFDLGDSLALEDTTLTCRPSWSGTQQSTRIAVTPELFKRLNAGVLLWNFQGHANPAVITHEDVYVNRSGEDDKSRFRNDDKAFLFAAFSCHPNFFTRIEEGNPSTGPSLGEEMVLVPSRRGAIASWASSGYEIIPFNPPNHLNVHLARALFARASWDSANAPYWDGKVILGQSIAKALLDNLPGAAFLERRVAVSYNLLGDPATRISIGEPQIAVTANGQPVASRVPVRLVSEADTLRLEIDIASNTQIDSISLERLDGVTLRVIPPSEYTTTPAFPDTAGGGRRYHLSYFTQLSQGAAQYVIRVIDKNGVPSTFEVVFRFFFSVLADRVPVVDGDPVKPDARFELKIVAPQIIQDPHAEFVLRVDSTVVTDFDAQRAPEDPSGRSWLITWDHAPYAPGEHVIALTVNGEFTFTTRVIVTTALALRNTYAFPNPFDDDLGTHFSFTLDGGSPANVLLRVYTVTGRLIYERAERGMSPGYHQIAWNGEDDAGDKLANGVYLYRLVAQSSEGSMVHEGRLVKLRKPRRRPGFEEP